MQLPWFRIKWRLTYYECTEFTLVRTVLDNHNIFPLCRSSVLILESTFSYVYLYICLSLHMSISAYVYLCICISLHMSISAYVYLCVGRLFSRSHCWTLWEFLPTTNGRTWYITYFLFVLFETFFVFNLPKDQWSTWIYLAIDDTQLEVISI